MLANIQEVSKALGSPSAPSVINQEPFDYDPGHYQRLCRKDARPSHLDLYSYADDLMYREIQSDLFRFLLPVCLSAWRQDLMASHESVYSAFVEQFSAALAKHVGFRALLSPPAYTVVSRFMWNSVLDKIDQERALSFSGARVSPYSWVQTIGTLGTAFIGVREFWDEWWSCRTVGRACGVLQYASVLMYPARRNPIFMPWTFDAGGGAPTLWETSGFIYDQSWLPENVDFLHGRLTPGYLREAISTAAVALRGDVESTVPDLMVADFENAIPRVELRIEQLLANLARPLGEPMQWPTE